MPDPIGTSFGRYHILEQLGEGGMAVVYKAYDTRLETDVAIKVIRTENFPQKAVERALKRFEREAKSLARLTHPNIVKVMDYGEHDGQPYLVLPYLPGGTLKGRMGRPIPWQDAVRFLLPIAEALGYAHNQNMIHRDIKPSNILLTQSGQPMLTDFGIAKVLDLEETLDLTGTGATVGTPEYMAPEQATSKTVDFRADIYALGVVFYEMVTGRKPYTADTPLAVLFKHVSDPLPAPRKLVPGLPESVEKVLLKALAKKPEDRYQTMKEMSVAFERLLSVRDRSPQRVSLSANHWNEPSVSQEAGDASPDVLPSSVKVMGILGLAVLVIALIVWGVSRLVMSASDIPVATLIPPSQPAVTETGTLPFTATPVTSTSYVVQEGDSLESIAQKFNLGPDGSLLIYYANQTEMEVNNGAIFVGQTIRIPAPGSILPTNTPVSTGLPGGTLVEYTVLPGDSLAGIAFRFNTSPEAIMAENGIDASGEIQVGQRLLIPVNVQGDVISATEAPGALPAPTIIPQTTLTDFTVWNDAPDSLKFSVNYDGSFGEVYVYVGCYRGSEEVPCVVMDVSPYGAVTGPITLTITLGMYGPDDVTSDWVYVWVSPTDGSDGFQWMFEYTKEWTILLPTPTAFP